SAWTSTPSSTLSRRTDQPHETESTAMRHQSKGRKFGRKSAPRNALKRDVVNALFRHGRITTTLPRAKEFRAYAERMITVAKRAAAGDKVVALNAFRKLIRELHDETIATKLVKEIAPAFAD